MERKFEIAARMLCLHVSFDLFYRMLDKVAGMFANCTHVIVSLLKAWKVTVVWIECNDTVFLMPYRDGPH